MSAGERGQATLEWSAVAVLVGSALLVLGAAATRLHAFALGDALVERITSAAVDRRCADPLVEAYGDEAAATLRH
jgi:hypothetical protein